MPDDNRRPIFFVANTSWYLWNFRKETISNLVLRGHSVVCVCPDQMRKSQLEGLGAELRSCELPESRFLRSVLWLFYTMYIVRCLRPKIIFSFTTSANFLFLLSGVAWGVPVVPNISGTGRLAKQMSPLKQIFLSAYADFSSKGRFVVFQNNEDRECFVKRRKEISTRCKVIHGSGVDLGVFEYTPMARVPGVKVAFMSRLIPEKGLRDLVRAIQMLPEDQFSLVIAGDIDPSGRDAITDTELLTWTKCKNITYLGTVENVLPILKGSDLIALPSYYGEGVPKILIEGCAVGRPILTTDTPGCSVTISNDNGYVVPPRSPKALAKALREFSALDSEGREAMSRNARALAERIFDVDFNICLYRALAEELSQRVW